MAKRRGIDANSLSGFLAREAREQKASVSRLLEKSPEELIVTGDVLGPLRVVSKEDNGFLFQVSDTYFCRFRVGDQVNVATVNPKTKKLDVFKSSHIQFVGFPKPGVVEVFLPKTMNVFEEDKEIFLLPSSSDGINWLVRKKLLDLDSSGLIACHKKIDLKPIKQAIDHHTETLNPVQKEALSFLVDNDLKGLVQGPPGTGKTHLIVNLIKLLIEQGSKVGVASLTHSAVDNVLSKLIRSGVSVDEVARVAGNINRIKFDLYEEDVADQLLGGSFKSLSARGEFAGNTTFKVLGATLHSFALSSQTPDIDVLIIDEASQVPIYFQSFLDSICSRVIQFGDHKQLPPVVNSEHHNLPAVDIFSYEIEKASYPMLETQYRMNKVVQSWSSERFYEGKLQPRNSNSERDVFTSFNHGGQFSSASIVHFHAHNGSSVNNASPYEASMVADLVEAIHKRGGLALSEIGIVTPHRSHAGAVCAQLQDKFGVIEAQNILVDTVERFQGQEKEVMLLSLGTDRDTTKKGDKGFIGDGRRLNVSVTRAKSRFYCLASNALVSEIKRQKNAGHLKSFFKWCNSDQEDEKETA